MYKKVGFFIFIFSLFLISLFDSKITKAQSCTGSLNCYVNNPTGTCDGSGAPCTGSCPPGAGTCTGFVDHWVPNGSINCSGIIGSGDPVICNATSLTCTDSSGNPAHAQCSWFVAPPPPTPGPTGSGGGGGGGGGCFAACPCAAGYSCVSGQCYQSGCVSAGPGSNQQGAYVYCQDGGGPIYPMSGIGIAISQVDINGGSGTCPDAYQVTDATGATYFSNLCTSKTYQSVGVPVSSGNLARISFVSGGAPITHPLAPWGSYNSLTLPTGQSYSNLTYGDSDGSVFTNCHYHYWYWQNWGPGWPAMQGASTAGTDAGAYFCGSATGVYNSSTIPSLASSYAFDIPNYGNGKYGIVLHFSNCTPPPPPPAWWQVIGGDAITGTATINGSLNSSVPTGSYFNVNSTFGGFPGNNLFGGTTNLTPALASTTHWLTNTLYQSRTYDSAYFNNVAPSNIVFNLLGTTTTQLDFNGGNISPDGFYYYKANGNLTTIGDISINGSRKVVIFVEGGDFFINGKINIQTKGSGFFMAIVGKDGSGNHGNIVVSQTVTGSPTLEGIFESDGNFQTGGGNTALYIRGTVVSWGGIAFQRDFGNATNGTTPAEVIEYGPDLTLLFPRSLIQDKANWQEIQP